jgi:hypothetical protein
MACVCQRLDKATVPLIPDEDEILYEAANRSCAFEVRLESSKGAEVEEWVDVSHRHGGFFVSVEFRGFVVRFPLQAMATTGAAVPARRLGNAPARQGLLVRAVG